MPKCLKDYADIEKMKAYRYRSRKRFYEKTQYARNTKQRWTVADLSKVLKREQTDSELSKEIGRSVQAIQTRRNLLHKKG